MNMTQTGDLTQQLFLRSQTARIKTDVHTLTSEMSSGRKTDVPAALGGHTRELASIMHGLKQSEAYQQTAAHAAGRLEAMQSRVGQIDAMRQNLADRLLPIGQSSTPERLKIASADAVVDFENMISQMNANHAGESLFSGTHRDRPALIDFQGLQSAIATVVSGRNTADGIVTAIDSWLDDPAGYATVAYRGDRGMGLSARIAPDTDVKLGLTASDQEFRNVMRAGALASAAVSNDSILSRSEFAGLLNHAGTAAFGSSGDIAAMQSKIGNAQSRVDGGMSHSQSHQQSLTIAYNALTAAVPFETATQLQAVQSQLEMHFAVTARLARLSLANYL